MILFMKTSLVNFNKMGLLRSCMSHIHERVLIRCTSSILFVLLQAASGNYLAKVRIYMSAAQLVWATMFTRPSRQFS